MTQQSCDMRRVDSAKDDGEGLDPGDFYIETDSRGQKMFHSCLPNGQRFCIPIRPLVNPQINAGHSWQWDGNEEKPTLTPSVHCVGIWHGFITAGRMVSV